MLNLTPDYGIVFRGDSNASRMVPTIWILHEVVMDFQSSVLWVSIGRNICTVCSDFRQGWFESQFEDRTLFLNVRFF
jgi:hypothetical protein